MHLSNFPWEPEYILYYVNTPERQPHFTDVDTETQRGLVIGSGSPDWKQWCGPICLAPRHVFFPRRWRRGRFFSFCSSYSQDCKCFLWGWALGLFCSPLSSRAKYIFIEGRNHCLLIYGMHVYHSFLLGPQEASLRKCSRNHSLAGAKGNNEDGAVLGDRAKEVSSVAVLKCCFWILTSFKFKTKKGILTTYAQGNNN